MSFLEKCKLFAEGFMEAWSAEQTNRQRHDAFFEEQDDDFEQLPPIFSIPQYNEDIGSLEHEVYHSDHPYYD